MSKHLLQDWNDDMTHSLVMNISYGYSLEKNSVDLHFVLIGILTHVIWYITYYADSAMSESNKQQFRKKI